MPERYRDGGPPPLGLTAGAQRAHNSSGAGGGNLRRGGQLSTTPRRQRILVVDDEPSIVDSVATSLRYEGFEVEQATNGRLALEAAQERTPDLIVLDVMLPDLDGLEVTRRLRSAGIRVPGLFLTAR